MEDNQIRQQIRSYIIDTFLFGQEEKLDDSSSLLEQGVLDSTGALELVSHLESSYGVRVEADEMVPENLDSVDLLCDFVKRKLAGKPPVAA